MRIAILGTGTMARLRATALSHDDRVDWIGIASADTKRACQAAEETHAHRWGTVDDVADWSPDAVIIASANAHHARQISMALKLEVPIFCEKPIATTVDESRALVDAAERGDVTLQVGFQRRFDAGYVAARQRITEGTVGQLYSIRLISHDHSPPPPSYMPTSGGLFRDLGVHDFDLARWLSGEEVAEVFTVSATRSAYSYLADHGDVDVAVVVLTMTSGLPVVVSLAWHNGAGHDVRSEITGAHDTLAVGYDTRAALTTVGAPAHHDSGPPRLPRYEDFVDRFTDALTTQTTTFVDLVSGESPNPCPGRNGVEALRIAIAAERSRAEHRPVNMAEIR
jgi:myo-inositol 2-dehydrogenase/D-chiro-inositol 1-dehydrogenase